MRNRFIIFFTLIILGACSLTAQRTTRKGLQPMRKIDVPADQGIVGDTVFHPGDLITMSGYEKPLRSRKETVHITNNSTSDILALQLNIIYIDYRGEELHSRKVKINNLIPNEETRLISYPSWDIQNRFYYKNGPVPQTDSYLFDIKIDVDWAIYNKDETEKDR